MNETEVARACEKQKLEEYKAKHPNPPYMDWSDKGVRRMESYKKMRVRVGLDPDPDRL